MTAKMEKWTFVGCPMPPQWNIDWNELISQYPLLDSLADCVQDKNYHQEGDVLTHTKMVCQSLIEDEQWQSLPQYERSLLFAAALFHDVGKPAKTEVEADGRITSFGHARKGARLVRSMFYRRNLASFETRELLFDLVRYHAISRQWVNRKDAQVDVIRATMRAPGKLLALLGRADSLGRVCDDREESAEGPELFAQLCQDIGCFEKPYRFPSPLSRFLYLNGKRPSPDLTAYDESKFRVVMMAGLPGAGKDSWLKRQRDKGREIAQMPIISLDEIRKRMKVSPADNQGQVVDAAKEEARKLLRQEKSFVWNATNVSRTLRQSLVSLFRRYGARVNIVYCETAYSELLRRNEERQAHVPLKVIEYLINKLEIPTYEEAEEAEWSLS